IEGWRSAERRTDACEASVGPALSGQARHLARRLASPTGDARLPGAPPWRFWAPVPRFLHQHLRRIRSASSSQPSRSAWRAGARASRDDGYESPPRHATPRSTFGIISGDAPRRAKLESIYFSCFMQSSTKCINLLLQYELNKTNGLAENRGISRHAGHDPRDVAALKKEGRSLPEIMAAKPTAAYDEKRGRFLIDLPSSPNWSTRASEAQRELS